MRLRDCDAKGAGQNMSVLIQYTAVASLYGRLQNVTQPIVQCGEYLNQNNPSGWRDYSQM
uniref:Uncharacterized protein n=1 Tax=Anguilla anguilla TaxID=7936 RepID=A0A0E9PUC8_ANGAN